MLDREAMSDREVLGYGAARYKRQREVTGAFPFWRYLAVVDPSTRESHRGLHEKVFRADDPIWNVIYPPNGPGCRCRVQTLTDAQVLRRGINVLVSAFVEDGIRAGWQDGEEEHVFVPDPGWGFDPVRLRRRRRVNK